MQPPASRIDIMSALTKTYGDPEAKALFDRFMKKGLLEKSGVGLVVPIPSMRLRNPVNRRTKQVDGLLRAKGTKGTYLILHGN